MLDGVMATSIQKPNGFLSFAQNIFKNRRSYLTRWNRNSIILMSSLLLPIEESKSSSESKKNPSSNREIARLRKPHAMLGQDNTVGVIGGLSAVTTLAFLEKLLLWSSKDEKESVPFIVCSDPVIKGVCSSLSSVNSKNAKDGLSYDLVIENLRRKVAFLEQSGARCIVMPCHTSHAWHREVAIGCTVPFLNAGDCVVQELKEAKLKPLEAGNGVRIGILATDEGLVAGFYEEKIQSQGYEVVLPDKPTMEHIVLPVAEALISNDMEGARNLLRIAIQTLLVRGVNTIILASDEFQGLLPCDDPLLKKCMDPMDALVRATIKWARSAGKASTHIQ